MSLTLQDLKTELAQYPTKDDLRAEYPTKEDLRGELARYPTKDELRAELARYPTKDDLHAELEQYSPKADVAALREEMAQGFADMRRYMEILVEDLKSWTKTLFDGTKPRIDLMDHQLTGRASEHERRIDDLDIRVTRLESSKRPPRR
jgi:hypothetical protein